MTVRYQLSPLDGFELSSDEVTVLAPPYEETAGRGPAGITVRKETECSNHRKLVTGAATVAAGHSDGRAAILHDRQIRRIAVAAIVLRRESAPISSNPSSLISTGAEARCF
jgi:hypothetical protein